MTPEQVIYDLPLAHAWAWHAWAIENDPWLAVERVTDGYIAQEREKNMHA